MTNHSSFYNITQRSKHLLPACSLMHLPRLVLSVMLAIAACTLCPSTASAQDIIRLAGKVLLKTDNEPLVGVNITDAAT